MGNLFFGYPLKKPSKSPYVEGGAVSDGGTKRKNNPGSARMGRSYAFIGNELGISKDTVKSFCRRNSLASADISVIDGTDRCRECGRKIEQRPKKKKQIFCCKACREKWWAQHPEQVRRRAVYEFTCANCGKPFTAYGNRRRKYCSHECYIADRFGGGSG